MRAAKRNQTRQAKGHRKFRPRPDRRPSLRGGRPARRYDPNCKRCKGSGSIWNGSKLVKCPDCNR